MDINIKQTSILTRSRYLRSYIKERINTCQIVANECGDPHLRQAACMSDLSMVLHFMDQILPEGKVEFNYETRKAGTSHYLS
jgi:hypothetical protein